MVYTIRHRREFPCESRTSTRARSPLQRRPSGRSSTPSRARTTGSGQSTLAGRPDRLRPSARRRCARRSRADPLLGRCISAWPAGRLRVRTSGSRRSSGAFGSSAWSRRLERVGDLACPCLRATASTRGAPDPALRPRARACPSHRRHARIRLRAHAGAVARPTFRPSDPSSGDDWPNERASAPHAALLSGGRAGARGRSRQWRLAPGSRLVAEPECVWRGDRHGRRAAPSGASRRRLGRAA